MVVCAKCSRDCKEYTMLCSECGGSFHATCTRIETIEKFKKLSTDRKSTWKCDQCKAERSSTASLTTSQGEASSIMAMIQSIGKELGEKISAVHSDVGNIKQELECVNGKIQGMQVTLNSLVVDNQNRKAEYERITKENADLKEDISDLRMQVLDLEQYSRRDNVEIVGIPYSEREDVHAILQQIANTLQLKYDKRDISVAHRLAVSKQRPNPVIIVRFLSREYKAEWMRSARDKRGQLTAASLSDSWPSTRVYINDHLTAYFKGILGRARRLVKERKISHAWTRDGKVFVRTSPDSPARVLRTPEDLDRLLQGSMMGRPA